VLNASPLPAAIDDATATVVAAADTIGQPRRGRLLAGRDQSRSCPPTPPRPPIIADRYGVARRSWSPSARPAPCGRHPGRHRLHTRLAGQGG
jgi:hypothetical protein